MKGNKQIVVSTTLLDKNKKLDRNLKEEIKEIAEQDNVTKTKMKVIQATKSDRDQAREQGISTGKYVEKKLNEDKEKVKVNMREPAPDKKVEEKVDIPKVKSETLSTENKSDGEKEIENNANAIKQKPSNEVKPTERKNLGTQTAQNKEQTDSKAENGKRNEVNGFKERRGSQK